MAAQLFTNEQPDYYKLKVGPRRAVVKRQLRRMVVSWAPSREPYRLQRWPKRIRWLKIRFGLTN